MSETLSGAAALYTRLTGSARQALVGQEQAYELLCVALITGGHVLLEGVPGTAKTLMAKLLALSLDAEFHRIQFTPDLMPSDIVGTNVFDLQSGRFHLKRGPVFTQVLLADEINRAPAKTQSALLEAMEEHQVTLDGQIHPLDSPFFVVATQNPIEHEGTYPLPEAQLDRFLFKILITYPGTDAELDILRKYDRGFDARSLAEAGLRPVASTADIIAARETARGVTVDESMFTYIASIVEATRSSPGLTLGASPRASIALLLASKTLAALRGREFVTPDDVKELAHPVLRHRLITRAEAELEGIGPDRVIDGVLSRVPVPR